MLNISNHGNAKQDHEVPHHINQKRLMKEYTKCYRSFWGIWNAYTWLEV